MLRPQVPPDVMGNPVRCLSECMTAGTAAELVVNGQDLRTFDRAEQRTPTTTPTAKSNATSSSPDAADSRRVSSIQREPSVRSLSLEAAVVDGTLGFQRRTLETLSDVIVVLL